MFRRQKTLVILSALVGAAIGCGEDGKSPTEPGVNAEAVAPSTSRRNDSLISVFVQYKANAPSTRLTHMRERGARFAHDMSRHRWLALELPPGAVQALHALPWVDSVEVDSAGAYLAADTYPWGIDSSGARAVHSFAKGTGVKIAYLDGGSRCTYADLTLRIVGGYDFVSNTSSYCQNTMSATPSLDHGTSVAQVLAASVNGLNLVGMAPEAKLYNLRVCEGSGTCSLAKMAAALDWARTNGMQVVSVSIANCDEYVPVALFSAIYELNYAGVVQVWAGGNGIDACGNTTAVSSFTRATGVIGVTSYLSGSGYVASYSHNEFLDIAAPTGVERVSIYGGAGCCFSGTSASTPHVAGAVALMIGQGFSGVDLITQRLTTTAEDRGAPGFDNNYGWGVLDVDSAVRRKPQITALLGATPPIKVAGSYPISAAISYGIAPIGVQFFVHYSNGVLPDNTTGFGANGYSLDVPAGSYTITVRMTPKESTYLRLGNTVQFDIPVCTEGGGGGDLAARMSNGAGTAPLLGGGVTPDGVGGCP
jgi:subtilisin